MIFKVRAAAFAVAAVALGATAFTARPTLASETEAVRAVSYIDHAAAPIAATEIVFDTDIAMNDPAPAAAPVPTPAPAAAEAADPVAGHDRAAPAEEAREEEDDDRDARRGRSLAQLVADYSDADAGDAQLDCLARAVYFESNGEPLVGQLAVAEVIINRSRSGRFPSTICGVVRQPSQFSFVRRGHIPQPPRGAAWRRSVAIAHIAIQDLADSSASRAMFFHARRVSPGWRNLTRIAAVGNHIFYR